METIVRRVDIPADRVLHLDVALPPSVEPGETEMLLVFSPLPDRKGGDLSALAGALSGSTAFRDAPVAIQRRLRNEWDQDAP